MFIAVAFPATEVDAEYIVPWLFSAKITYPPKISMA
jgi:hypothetical protein